MKSEGEREEWTIRGGRYLWDLDNESQESAASKKNAFSRSSAFRFSVAKPTRISSGAKFTELWTSICTATCVCGPG